MNLSQLIQRNAAFTPDKPAMNFEGAAMSYAEFEHRIEKLARALQSKMGVVKGDRVAILSLNRPEYLVLLYACARIGAIMVPLNWRLAIAEQLFILADAEVKALFVEKDFAAVVAPFSEAAPDAEIVGLDHESEGAVSFDALLSSATDVEEAVSDLRDPLLIVYTSGTTGRPKGAVLTQDALLWNGVMSQHMHGLTAADHVLTVLPFFHVGGLNIQTTAALQCGATVTIHARFAPQATLDAVAREKPTLTVLVPATLQALIDHPDWNAADLSSLRAIATGSQIVPQQLIDAFVARGVPVLQVYGSTETSPIAIYTRLGGDAARPGSTGLAGLFCEAKVMREDGREAPVGEAGEICVRGPNVLTGYWRNEAATREALVDGWFHTGDIGYRDADGHFFINDRKKNMIISGGENIYPAEVERVLIEHPDIADACVVGRPDARWQEIPVAYVQPRADCATSDDALRASLAERAKSQLARFKQPREIIIVADLPRTALGKAQHFRLRQIDQERQMQTRKDS
ncbi:long-chain-fatty-acid--CoA ligase [Terrarubrum flagellatum]|uniref:class I adenylate-forming enzyme family protein n=1 Tax=Terrirubrum flagellatum TaxID=2895980 RepID=UPI003145416B